MDVFVTNRPCMLLETAELLYAFVNDIPINELTCPGAYTIPPSALQQIVATATEGLSRQDVELQFFFARVPLQDGSGATCLARCLVYNGMDFSCETLGESFAVLRRKWRELRQCGEHFASIGEFGFDYTEPTGPGFTPLAAEIERLNIAPQFRQKLLEAFAGFDEYSGMLERCLAPVTARLEKLLEPWAERAKSLADGWEARFQGPDAEDILQQRAHCSGNSIKGISVGLRYLYATTAPGVLDSKTETVYFHMGVAREFVKKVSETFEDWEYHALRLLGSPARMKMLQAMAEKPMTSREMAQQLELHLGAVGRDVKSLFDAGLLSMDASQGRNRYKLNLTAIETIIRHLQSLLRNNET